MECAKSHGTNAGAPARTHGGSCRRWRHRTFRTSAKSWRKIRPPPGCTGCGWPPSGCATRWSCSVRATVPALETRLAALRKLQQRFGRLDNDCVAAWNLLSKTMTRSPQRARVRKLLRRGGQEAGQDFREEWQQLFRRRPAGRSWWTRVSARHARAQKRGLGKGDKG